MPKAVKATHSRYMEQLAAYTPQEPITGPLRVKCTVWYKSPSKGKQGAYRDRRPDLDNLWKGLADCITKAQIWGDDSQIAELDISKRYCCEGDHPHITVSIRRITEND